MLLDFHVLAGTRFSLRDKRLFEISEFEIARVNCISLSQSHTLWYANHILQQGIFYNILLCANHKMQQVNILSGANISLLQAIRFYVFIIKCGNAFFCRVLIFPCRKPYVLNANLYCSKVILYSMLTCPCCKPYVVTTDMWLARVTYKRLVYLMHYAVGFDTH